MVERKEVRRDEEESLRRGKKKERVSKVKEREEKERGVKYEE